MPTNVEQFKAQYQQAAINAAAGTKIFPETILSAAALESGYGKSGLAARYNNFFGIKADASWTGKTVTLPTKEQKQGGQVYKINAKFRWYNSPEDCFRSYIKFISGPRYQAAGVLNAATPEAQFDAIKRAGYATDVSYAEKLKEALSTLGGYFSDLLKNPGASTATVLLCIGLFYFLTRD